MVLIFHLIDLVIFCVLNLTSLLFELLDFIEESFNFKISCCASISKGTIMLILPNINL